MKNLSLFASALAVLGLTSCEETLVDDIEDVGNGQVKNSVLQVRTRAGGSADETTIAYPVTVYAFAGDECRAVQFFGDDIAKANSGEDSRIGKRGPQNLLELLPDEFTTEDAKRVRLQQGLDNSGNRCRNMIYQWISRKYVLQLTVDSFKKTPPASTR